MRHYEVVFLVHPDQSEQVPAMVDRYVQMIEKKSGRVHRKEDWGRRQLAYPINKLHKAHYMLLNIECSDEVRKDLESAFRFNDAILRHMILLMPNRISEPSILIKEKEKEERRAIRIEEQKKVAAEEAKAASEALEAKPVEGANEDPSEAVGN